MDDDYKFGFLNPDDQAYRYPNVWAIEQTSGPCRLAIAPENSQVDALLNLIETMPEPFWILYVLVVPRKGNEPGRYQSPEPQTRDAMGRILREFKAFLENDGRHNLWIKSESSPAMLVYDRHNLIYGYGPLEEFEAILSKMGLKESPSIQPPVPHSHHYNASFDIDEHRILEYWPWHYTPLKDTDDN